MATHRHLFKLISLTIHAMGPLQKAGDGKLSVITKRLKKDKLIVGIWGKIPAFSIPF